MSITAESISMLVSAIGLLAFTVSVVIEVIKGLPIIKRIPTDLTVIVVSLSITVAAFIAYASSMNIVVTWYTITGSIIGGLFVAFVAMYGWTKFTEIWSNFKK